MEERLNEIKKFLLYVKKFLGIEKIPKIILINDNEVARQNKSFGGYFVGLDKIQIVIHKRNLADIMRTLAHELVHYKQDKEGRLGSATDGSDGSDIENEANSLAAVIMRKYGRNNSNIYENENKIKINKQIITEEIVSQLIIENIFDTNNKKTVINRLYKIINPYTKGFFYDESWEGVHKIFKIFEELGFDFTLNNTEYDHEFPPKHKIWYFTLEYTDNNGRKKEINGNLTASGGGSVDDPLERYDISVVLY